MWMFSWLGAAYGASEWESAMCHHDLVGAGSTASTAFESYLNEALRPGQPVVLSSLAEALSSTESPTSFQFDIVRGAVEGWAGLLGQPVNDQASDDPVLLAQTAWSAPGSATTTPLFWTATGMPAIDVSVGGKRVRMGLDTGANVNVISEKFVPRGAKRTPASFDNGGQVGSASYAEVSVDVAGQGPRTSTFLALPARALRRHGVDGLLGWPLFGGMRVTIDGVRGEVTFAPSSTTSVPNMRWWGFPLIRGEIEGQPALFWLDTGGRTAFYASARERRIPLPSGPVQDVAMKHLGGRGVVRTETIQEAVEIDFGGLATRVSGPTQVLHQDRSFWCIDARVGAEGAKDGRLVVDGPASVVQLTKGAH